MFEEGLNLIIEAEFLKVESPVNIRTNLELTIITADYLINVGDKVLKIVCTFQSLPG